MLRSAGLDTPTAGPDAHEIDANLFPEISSHEVVQRLCPRGTKRYRPFIVNDAAMACTRHREVPHPDTARTMAEAAKTERTSPRSLDRDDVRLRSLLASFTWWIRDFFTVAVPMINASDVGDRPEARMGLLRSHREAMNEIFATIRERGGIDKKDAASLRTAIESCLTWCVDLLAWAPFFTEPRPENPAGVWKELRQQQDPLHYVIPLLEDAIPPFRHPILEKMRNSKQCSICALHYDMIGQELGLAESKKYRRTQHGGALCRGGAQIGDAPPPPLPCGKERRPDSIEPWDTRLSEGEQAVIRCDGPCRKKRNACDGAFRDARMRAATIGMRPITRGTGAASAAWHCGLCLLRSLQEEDVPVQTPTEALLLVRRNPSVSVPDDPGSTTCADPITREALSAPAGEDITVDAPLYQLLIDTDAHPQFDPAVTRDTIPARTGDSRFGGARTVAFHCEGCQTKHYVQLGKRAQPAGAFMARQHKHRRNRLEITPPLPARRVRKHKWSTKRWAALWRCRQCLYRIYDARPSIVDTLLNRHRKVFLPAPASTTDAGSSSVDSEGEAGTVTDEERENRVASIPSGLLNRGPDARAISPARSRASDVECWKEELAEARAAGEVPVQTDRLDGVRAWRLKHYDGLAFTKDPTALQVLVTFLDSTGGRHYSREDTERARRGTQRRIPPCLIRCRL